MNFSFKKFLPVLMRDTRWGQLAEVWQDIYEDLDENKIQPIFDQYDIDAVDSDGLKNIANLLGFNLLSLTGYTSTYEFLYKEVKTIVARRNIKTTQDSYSLNGVPFNLISTGYAVIYDSIIDKYIVDETLIGASTYGTTTLDRGDKAYVYYNSLITADIGQTCDTGLSSDVLQKISSGTYIDLDDTTLDATNFPNLDGNELLYSLTRNFVFNYKHRFVESESEFMSLNTLKVLLSDIKQNKRITDRCFFEPYLFTEVTSDMLETDKIWYDYENVATATQKSILISDELTDITTVRFGNGAHTTIDSSITDVNSFTFEKDYDTEIDEITIESSHLNFRLLIEGVQKLSAFTEIALMDFNGDCILYTTFPKIQWDSDMFNNIKLDFTIV